MIDAATLSAVLGEQLSMAQLLGAGAAPLLGAQSDTPAGKRRRILVAAMVARISPSSLAESENTSVAAVMAVIESVVARSNGRYNFDEELAHNGATLSRTQVVDLIFAVPGAYRAQQRVRLAIEHLFSQQLGEPL